MEWRAFHLPPSSVHFSILLAAHRPVDAAFELLSVPAARAGIGRVERHRRAGLTADARLPTLKSAGIESRRWRPRRARPSRRDRRTGRGTAAPPAPTAAPSSPAPAGARANSRTTARLQTSGWTQCSPGKREKSASVEWSTAWCSSASAARCASVVRLAPVPRDSRKRNRIAAWRSPA